MTVVVFLLHCCQDMNCRVIICITVLRKYFELHLCTFTLSCCLVYISGSGCVSVAVLPRCETQGHNLCCSVAEIL